MAEYHSKCNSPLLYKINQFFVIYFQVNLTLIVLWVPALGRFLYTISIDNTERGNNVGIKQRCEAVLIYNSKTLNNSC